MAIKEQVGVESESHVEMVNTATLDVWGALQLFTKAFAADGAIDIKAGMAKLTKAGVNAMTLANPTAGLKSAATPGDDGKILIITAQTANVHTVTCTGGFAGAGSGADVATFGGAIGDNMVLIACNGLWHVLSLRNVTLG